VLLFIIVVRCFIVLLSCLRDVVVSLSMRLLLVRGCCVFVLRRLLMLLLIVGFGMLVGLIRLCRCLVILIWLLDCFLILVFLSLLVWL